MGVEGDWRRVRRVREKPGVEEADCRDCSAVACVSKAGGRSEMSQACGWIDSPGLSRNLSLTLLPLPRIQRLLQEPCDDLQIVWSSAKESQRTEKKKRDDRNR